MTLPNNTLLQGGKYRIVRFISSGGFGCTYEAEHVMLGKRVAIKEFFVKDFCNRDETTSHVTVGTQTKIALVSKLKRKFIEEASALGRFNHPNIVHVSDVFEENGTAYYVMDFIDGKSINEILKTQASIPESKAVKYILQVAEALKQVHSQNRLHLDIKPGNIMIDSNDNAVLIDFGASKQYDEEAGENTSTLVGRTPGYAPLEQLGNDIVKFMPATDIYALGATLYKMLSGKTPLSATLLASGEELEPLPINITESTRNAIKKAMVINKRERYQTIEDFICELGQSKIVESTCETNHSDENTEFDDTIGDTDNLGEDNQVNYTDENDSTDFEMPNEDDKGRRKKLTVPLVLGFLLIIVGVLIYMFASTSSPENLFEKGKEAFEQNDYETAFDYYLQAANKGDGRAQNNVGQMYLSGQGVEQNYEEAYNWLKKAADQDLSKGKVNL